MVYTKTIENNWSRTVLKFQIETDLFTRQYKKQKATNFHLTLPKLQGDLANQLLKDPYILPLMHLGEKLTERQLENALVNHVQDFILELGAGFAYMGRQIKLKVGQKLKYIDLLFFHVHLNSYVVIELKMVDFDWSFVGQMNGYLNAVNKQIKRPDHNLTIGIILCTGKDNIEVEFALENINQPIGVSDYEFTKELPKHIKDKLPTAKQLQDEVKKFLKQNKMNRK